VPLRCFAGVLCMHLALCTYMDSNRHLRVPRGVFAGVLCELLELGAYMVIYGKDIML
jgi:hypothetical protein